MFRTDLEYKEVIPGCLWQLTHPLIYDYWRYGYKRRIIVPAGYYTDFLSLPLLSKAIFTKDGAGKWASVIHDYCYVALQDEFTQKQADKIFRQALRNDPEKPTYLTQLLFYTAVRLGGYTTWQKRFQTRQALIKKLTGGN